MNINQTKIEYLRKAAEKILNPDNEYNWEYSDICNCGWLVKVIKPDVETFRFNYYSDHVRRCGVTGLTDNAVVNILLKAGFTANEVIEIENIENSKTFTDNDPEINRKNAANHLLAIANRLEMITKVKNSKAQTVKVSC